MKPILEAIREVLKFKEYTTVSEISKLTGISALKILQVLNHNEAYLQKNSKNGRIIGVDSENTLKQKSLAMAVYNGKYYTVEDGNYGIWHNLKFNRHEKIRSEIEIEDWEGGYGDALHVKRVSDIPENRAKLEADGCHDSKGIVFDDSLWEE
ncbi:Uncharacterised protein [uncultured archaeon]|nr:Uncharacterised protein [uncultured archaeon]